MQPVAYQVTASPGEVLPHAPLSIINTCRGHKGHRGSPCSGRRGSLPSLQAPVLLSPSGVSAKHSPPPVSSPPPSSPLEVEAPCSGNVAASYMAPCLGKPGYSPVDSTDHPDQSSSLPALMSHPPSGGLRHSLPGLLSPSYHRGQSSMHTARLSLLLPVLKLPLGRPGPPASGFDHQRGRILCLLHLINCAYTSGRKHRG